MLCRKTNVVVDEKKISRRISLNNLDFEKHGYSDCCPRCTYLQTGVGFKTQNHNVLCRDRMEAEIAMDPENKRLKQATKKYEHLITAEQQRVVQESHEG